MNLINWRINTLLYPLISVIMPTYNTKEFIERGINSVLNQTYQNIELIVINDGSTDGTREFLEDLSLQDHRLIVHHQKNLGVSVARNKGLDLCRGKYVCFLDSDDWLSKDAIYFLYEQIDNKNNIISACNMNNAYIKNNNIVVESKKEKIESEYLLAEEALLKMGTGEIKLQSSCYKLYPTFLLNQNDKIRFDTDISNGEDGLFVFNVMKKAKGIIYTSIPKWNILARKNSTTRNGFNTEMLTALISVNRMIESSNNNKELKRHLKVYYTKRAIGLFIELSNSKHINKKDKLILRKALIKYKKDMYSAEIPFKNRIKYHVLLHSPLSVIRILNHLNGLYKTLQS